RGYDVHLHYANYGTRTMALRLPAGPPFAKTVWFAYLGQGQLSWSPDPGGNGGILTLDPFHEPGELDEVWEFDQYLQTLIELRSRLMAGDLRVLYLLWLASVFDDQEDWQEVVEPPVPDGLGELVDVARPLFEFFGLDPLLLAAAAEVSTAAPSV